jgi:hypothetical protein
MRVIRWCSGLFFAAAVLIVAGCGPSEPKRYSVSGTVKYKNEPVKFGTISFRSEDGQSTGAAQVTDGKYEIPAAKGLIPGTYKVSISYPDPKAPKPKDTDDGLPGEVVDTRDLLPAKYNRETELTAEIKAESNQIDFDLK